MFTRFFIDRPIFASVISIAITLAGALALVSLPIAMFPQIAPPTVSVSCQYPGANAQVVAETIAAPIEQQVNGVENMMYMSSSCTNDGNYSLTVTFKHGVDLNLAQVLVQNRVSLAVPMLPDVIKATGVITKKRSPDILLAIGLYSPDGRYDQLYLSNYASLRIRDEMARLPGVSDVMMFGQRDYSMRIWLDPDKLAQRSLSAGDVVRALREQNLTVATGQVGQSPSLPGQQTQLTLTTRGRLVEPQQFENVIVRSTAEGRLVRVKDIGRVELAPRNQDVSSEIGARRHYLDEEMELFPVANMGIFQLPDANALETADIVKAKIAELKADFPDGMDYMIRYDTTPYIRESIQEVFEALLDSVILVALVVLLFLQNWRSALIPLIAVPVGIIGTFAVMAAFGFSLNNLTLFGLVLAIGIVVDDAIVVVESVEHHIEEGLEPKAATIQAMSEVSAPVIAVGLVLSAVFVPCAFISGITGQFFRQFALTIASATVLSTINSLTLSPALAALLLQPRERGNFQALPGSVLAALGFWQGYERLGPRLEHWISGSGLMAQVATASTLPGLGELSHLSPEVAGGLAGGILGAIICWTIRRPFNRALGGFFELFNRGFRATAHGYSRLIGGMLRVFGLVLLAYLGLLYLSYHQFRTTPKGFIPSQDMGYMLASVQLPDSAATERTRKVLHQMSEIATKNQGVAATVGITGQSLLLSAFGSNFGTMFITLDPFAKRRPPQSLGETIANFGRRLVGLKEKPPRPDLYFETVMNKLRGQFATAIPEATISIFGPPPVRGVGRAGGWMLIIEDRGDMGPAALQAEVENLVTKGNEGIDPSGSPISGGAGTGPASTPTSVQGLASVFRANVPQVYLDIDRSACMLKGVELRDVFTTLQAYLGSLYVNDFNRFGRTWQVIVQAEPKYRDQKEDISRLQVRNRQGTMVPLGAVAKVREINGPLVLTRYNMYPSASINGSAGKGISSGSAIHAMEGLADRELPRSMSYEWTEMAYLELQAGNTAVIVFGFSIVMVFLVLAAQFESWAMPLAVILSVPLCMLSALYGVTNAKSLGVNYTSQDINIFTQIGLVVLVGLASKNSILIVQFAKLIHLSRGRSIREATLESCRLRLRPIVMTSMAFILGVVPLLFAHGAGAEMRQSLGVAVFSGMLGVTFFGLMLTPVFFYVIDGMAESHVFANPRVRRVARILLMFLVPVVGLRELIRARQARTDRKSGRVQGPIRGTVIRLEPKRSAVSRFFIDRPIFASVLSIIITLAGGITYFTLPVAQYPEITPPTVEVSAYYPGANAQVVADTVAAPIEQQVNGVENMMYMSSQCTNDGTYTLTVTFKPGTDLNMAQVLVQNKESLAEPILPDLVKRRGVSVKKKSPSILMIINVFSPDGTKDNLYLSNYATIQLRDELARLDGVGDITYIGQRNYSMRVWLDPQKMTFRNLTSSDVVAAIQQQNIQVAAGQLGQPPVANGQAFQFTISTKGRLSDTDDFSDMILKTDAMGGVVRLRDVGRVELEAQGYDQDCTLDGQPTVALSVYQRPGSNALETARLVRQKMEELKERFPEGIDYAIVYDTTPFITESVNEVFKTLRDAVILVALVVLLFLQNWRSALIPLVAVPVAIVGTLAVMAALGFSLNNLTLFGLVLAIGIVVDDAIVVVEAVEHHIEVGLKPRAATIKAMEQVSAPVIAVGLVLAAVFIPCAFISGIIGQFYRQFALTIATSTVISAFNSLTLSPALAALLLRPRQKGVYQALPRVAFLALGGWLGFEFLGPVLVERSAGLIPGTLAAPLTRELVGSIGGAVLGGIVGWAVSRPLNRLMGWSFFQFNRAFDATTSLYARLVGGLLRVSALVLLVYGGLLVLTYWGFTRTPTGFIPAQDKGYLLVNVQLPDSSSLERTQATMRKVEQATRKQPGVAHTLAIAGQSILMNANAPNFGAMYVMLDEFHHRASEHLTGPIIAARLQEALQEEIREGLVNVFEAPTVDGLGTAGGFKIVLEDRGDLGSAELEEVANRVVGVGSSHPMLQGLFTSFRANTPWLFLDIDREKAKLMGVSIAELFNTLQVYLGSLYVNDFNRFGRTWQVNVQGDADFRRQIDDLSGLQVRSERGSMVPLGSLAQIRDVSGPVMIIRYNLYPSATVNLNAAPGVSSGQALRVMDEVVAQELPQRMRSVWTELALLQNQTGNTAMYAFALAVVLVFLVLAAQYESWALPLAVILVVPMCLLCSTVGVNMARLDINIFTQVGFIVLVGLACKNAILIVEFAKKRSEFGANAYEATLDACELRLRPIMMTSLAFILGVVPLILSTGAGSEMRQTLGVAVFSGMLGVTLFGIFLTPVFFYVIQWFSDRRSRRNPVPSTVLPEPSDHAAKHHASNGYAGNGSASPEESHGADPHRSDRTTDPHLVSRGE